MTPLIDDMTRLRDEITSARDAREGFLKDLQETVSQMRDRFQEAHAEMASELRQALAANEAARKRQADDDRAERHRRVSGMLGEFAVDLEGARQAWFGTPKPQRPSQEKQGQPQRRANAKKSSKSGKTRKAK